MVVLLIVALVLVLCLVGAHAVYRLALVPGTNRTFVMRAPHNTVDDAARVEQAERERARQELDDWFAQASVEEMALTAYDGLKLSAYLFPSDTSSHRWAVAVHGYTSNARQMLGFAKRFVAAGYHALLPDCRGHGKSEGKYIGMGWHDRLDILAWVQEIIRRDPEAQIVLYGISMGAATVMMASGEELPKNVFAIVEDCGYTSVWEEFAYQFRALFHLPLFPLVYLANGLTRLYAGYWQGEASALAQVKKSRTPIFFIHGEEDTFVPAEMVHRLYSAAACEKELLVVPGAGHGGAMSVMGEDYWARVFCFIDRYR